MTLYSIKETTTVIDNVHESCYQAYQILELVTEMLKRGDSQKTILLVIEHLKKEDKP
jgi:fatty acid-binding protein DegV